MITLDDPSSDTLALVAIGRIVSLAVLVRLIMCVARVSERTARNLIARHLRDGLIAERDIRSARLACGDLSRTLIVLTRKGSAQVRQQAELSFNLAPSSRIGPDDVLSFERLIAEIALGGEVRYGPLGNGRLPQHHSGGEGMRLGLVEDRPWNFEHHDLRSLPMVLSTKVRATGRRVIFADASPWESRVPLVTLDLGVALHKGDIVWLGSASRARRAAFLRLKAKRELTADWLGPKSRSDRRRHETMVRDALDSSTVSAAWWSDQLCRAMAFRLVPMPPLPLEIAKDRVRLGRYQAEYAKLRANGWPTRVIGA
jgi:hypothetical protein